MTRPGLEAAYRGREVLAQPWRITTALDAHRLYGPEVDVACLAVEPAVDEWEAGRAAPSWEQLVALAALTGFDVEWFLRPVDPSELGARAIVCQRSGPGRGCRVVTPPAPVPPYDGLPLDVTPVPDPECRVCGDVVLTCPVCDPDYARDVEQDR